MGVAAGVISSTAVEKKQLNLINFIVSPCILNSLNIIYQLTHISLKGYIKTLKTLQHVSIHL